MKVRLIRTLFSIVGRANKNKQNKITSNGYILINIEYVVVNCKHPNGLFVSFKPPDTLRLHERLWMFVYRGCPLAHRKRCSRGAMRHPVVASSSLWWEWCVHVLGLRSWNTEATWRGMCGQINILWMLRSLRSGEALLSARIIRDQTAQSITQSLSKPAAFPINGHEHPFY